MMNTESIQAEEEALKQQLEALEAKKREIAEKTEEAKQKAIEEQRKNGRANAIKALLALDEGGLIVQEDDRLYVVSGDVREELIVEEDFEHLGYWQGGRGKSKGFWFKLNQWCFTGEGKTRRWKKPESAYKSIKELVGIEQSRQKDETDRKAWMDIAISSLSRAYQDAKVEKYHVDVVKVKTEKGHVLFVVGKGGKLYFNDAKANDKSELALLILGEPADA